MSIEKRNALKSNDNKSDKSKEEILSPEKLKNLIPFDGTEKETISFAKEGGKTRWYLMEDGNEGDGDSLYAKISKGSGDEFYLVDGKNIKDVGNFVVGFFNNINKEIEVDGEKYPMAVYLKRRDRISPHKTDNISDTDVMRDEAYKFCFYDKNIDSFITTTMDNDFVSRGEIKNWAEVKQEGDELIIDYPKYGVYNDGYQVGEKGGAKSFEISDLINQGKLEKARELLSKNDKEKATKLAENVVQTKINKNKKINDFDFKDMDNIIKICQEFSLKETSDLSDKYLNRLFREDLNRVDIGGIEKRFEKAKKLLILSEEMHDSQDFVNYKKEIFNQFINRNFYYAMEFYKEYIADLPEMKSKVESLMINEIKSRIESAKNQKNLLTEVEYFLKLGNVDPQLIKNEIKKAQASDVKIYAFENLISDDLDVCAIAVNILHSNFNREKYEKQLEEKIEVAQKINIDKEVIKKLVNKNIVDSKKYFDSEKVRSEYVEIINSLVDKINSILNKKFA